MLNTFRVLIKFFISLLCLFGIKPSSYWVDIVKHFPLIVGRHQMPIFLFGPQPNYCKQLNGHLATFEVLSLKALRGRQLLNSFYCQKNILTSMSSLSNSASGSPSRLSKYSKARLYNCMAVLYSQRLYQKLARSFFRVLQ